MHPLLIVSDLLLIAALLFITFRLPRWRRWKPLSYLAVFLLTKILYAAIPDLAFLWFINQWVCIVLIEYFDDDDNRKKWKKKLELLAPKPLLPITANA